MSSTTINTTTITSYTLHVTALTVTNTGEIDAASITTSVSQNQQGADAVFVAKYLASGTVQNAGTLIAGAGPTEGGGTGVYLYGHDEMSNSGLVVGGYSTGLISGGTGVYLAAQEGASLSNTGTIAGGNGENFGGTGFAVGNQGNFQFYPQNFSANSSLASNVVNNGLIVGGAGESQQAGSFGGAGGTGVFLGAGTLDNEGIVLGGSSHQAGGYGINVFGTFGTTLINGGTISGGQNASGSIATAILFDAATIASTLVAETGAVFIGAVDVAGTAPDTLLLAAGTQQTAGTLDMGGSFSGFATIAFAADTPWSLSGNTTELAGGEVIDGFAAQDTLVLSGFTATGHTYLAGSGLEVSNGTITDILDIKGNFSTQSFTVRDTSQGTAITLCYLQGTLIATPAGQVTVETLKIGDAVITRFGGYQRIKWIGRQSFAARFIRGNQDQLPVRISAGALGPNIPREALHISPGHSMLIGGTLVLARNLVNGITITQVETAQSIEYYAIDLGKHDCVLANQAWSETFADGPGLRNQFHNHAEFHMLYPDDMEPETLVLCAPRPLEGPTLEAALSPVLGQLRVKPGHLRGYIEILDANKVEGWAWDESHPNLPVRVEICANGKVLGTALACHYRADLAKAGLGRGYCMFSFSLPANIGTPITVRRAADGAEITQLHTCRAVA
ncbi:Hint domain-containing protein [Acidocella sp.]|uniref:Hint domain-containing protein n=1 Tax=Acidocella sp. TaxID=50710 RepID=UPI00261A67BB|nr:Hint domain-containing protein [Acidocella sp.]